MNPDTHRTMNPDTHRTMKTASFRFASFRLPAYWASYLVNGDASGIDAEEQSAADAFLATVPEWRCASCEGEPFFAHSNAAGTLAGDCLDYTFFSV